MASQLAHLLVTAFGKQAQPSPAKTATRNDDQFARILDAQPATPAPARSETPAASSTPAEAGSQPAADDTTPKDAPATTDAANAAPAEATSSTVEDDDKSTSTKSLADTLLAALAALGLVSETPATGAAGTLDAKALKDIEGSLEELSDMLGMDMTTLMQQLATLAKGVAAEGGGEGELVAKLNAWVGEKLGRAPDANVEASLAKLVSGLGEFAKAIPTEPELASAQLKLPEPVLAATKAAAPAETVEVAAPEIKVDPASLERKAESDKPAAVDASHTKPQHNNQQAARPANGNDNTLNLTPVAHVAPTDAPTPQVDASTTPRVVQTGYQTNQQQLNLPQLAFEMSRQVSDGNTRFQIRLDPAELGRIDVKLDIDSNGQVHAKLTVEKAETLDLMQRDQRALEKALQQAGLDQSKTNLEFSLKQNPFAGDQNQRGGNDQGEHSGGQDGQQEAEIVPPAITLYRGALQASGVNIIA